MKPLSKVTQVAFNVLVQEIGIVDTLRFLNQYTGGFGNYTEEREAMFGDLTMEEILENIRQEEPRENK